MSLKTEIKEIQEQLKSKGFNVDNIGASGLMSDEELLDLLKRVSADITKSQTSNSSKINKGAKAINDNHFYLGFIPDTHSKWYLLEYYLNLLNHIDGKCICVGDFSNGSNLDGVKHHPVGLLDETLNISHDTLAISDIYKRYPNMMLSSIEGNHDQWSSNVTGVHIGREACKFAGISQKYADNMQIVTQKVTYEGKEIPFNFLVVHGEGMPHKIVTALKKSLQEVCQYNVDAMIFGHTHVMGSSSTTIMSLNGKGKWTERGIASYNPGTVLEGAAYADGKYPPLTPFDGAVMRCSVVPTLDGKGYKKCIDLENINDIVPESYRKILSQVDNSFKRIQKKNYGNTSEIDADHFELRKKYLTKEYPSIQFKGGQHLIVISGTSDMFAPDTPEEIRVQIKQKLRHLVDAAKNVSNLSIVLNGDLIYDYNKGYIVKKDYSADTIADIQELCDILKPVADKIVAINNGKMETGIMVVEKDKATGRYSKGKKGLKALANYASQVLQIDDAEAYAPYNREEMRTKKLAIQNSQVNEENQKVLNKAYEDFLKKVRKDSSAFDELAKELDNANKLDTKKIKEALVKKLRREHKILDISNEEDRKIINQRYPLAYIDLRIPNENLIGNMFCKMLGISSKNVKCNHIIDAPSIFKVNTATGDTKVVYAYHTPSLGKFMQELTSKLNRTSEPPDVVVVNSSLNKTNVETNEFTTQVRMNYINKNGTRKTKDIIVIDSGSFGYGKLYTNNKVASTKIYKVVDVDPIFTSLLPKDAVNYSAPNKKRLAVLKYEPESVNLLPDPLRKNIKQAINKNQIETTNKFLDKFRESKTPNHVESQDKKFEEEYQKSLENIDELKK